MEQLEKNLVAVKAGPLEDELVRVVAGIWEDVKEEAARYCR